MYSQLIATLINSRCQNCQETVVNVVSLTSLRLGNRGCRNTGSNVVCARAPTKRECGRYPGCKTSRETRLRNRNDSARGYTDYIMTLQIQRSIWLKECALDVVVFLTLLISTAGVAVVDLWGLMKLWHVVFGFR